MLIIFYDNVKNVQNIIAKIKNENSVLVKEISIQDYLKNNSNFEINVDDVVYILSNDNVLNNKLIENLSIVDCKILNKNYYLSNYDKQQIQQILFQNCVPVPKIINLNDDFVGKVICKPKNHTLAVNIFDDMNSLRCFLKNKDANEYYIEKFEEYEIEYKIYFVNNKMFFYEEVNAVDNKLLNETLNKISDILKLDVYSVDVLFNAQQFYIIDINPSAGLFKSKDARIALIDCAS